MSNIQTLELQNSSNTHVENENTDNQQLVLSEPFTDIEGKEHPPLHHIQYDNIHFIALGRFRVSPEFATETELQKYFAENFWEILLNIITSLYGAINEANAKPE